MEKKFDIVSIYQAWAPGDTLSFYGIHWDGEAKASSGMGRSYDISIVDDGVEPPRLMIKRRNDYPFSAKEAAEGTLTWRQKLLRWWKRQGGEAV